MADSPPRSDAEVDADARQGLLAAEQIVASFLPNEAVTFRNDDSPRTKVEKLVRATRELVSRREWPNAVSLLWASFGGSAGAGSSQLASYYQNYDNPDVKGWPRMSEYGKGEAIRRMYVDRMELLGKIAAGQMTPEQHLATRKMNTNLPWSRLVGEAFGSTTRQQYDDALGSDDRVAAEQLKAAAWVYLETQQVFVMYSL